MYLLVNHPTKEQAILQNEWFKKHPSKETTLLFHLAMFFYDVTGIVFVLRYFFYFFSFGKVLEKKDGYLFFGCHVKIPQFIDYLF